MAQTVNIRRAQHDQLKAVSLLAGLEQELLRGLGVTVGAASAPRKAFGHRARQVAPPVVDAEGADVNQSLDAGEAHRLGHIDRAQDVDLEAPIEGLRDPPPPLSPPLYY